LDGSQFFWRLPRARLALRRLISRCPLASTNGTMSPCGSTIEKDKPLTVNYRLWLQEGLMQPEAVAALNNNFVDPVTVTLHEAK
jgi:hypothetical protein